LVCAAKGYRIHIVSSDAFSQEKRDHMAALGAELTLVPSEGGLTTKKLILDMIEAARDLSRRPHTYWTDQLNNHDSIAGYYPLGEEIWSQTQGKVDAFVHCAGTAASSRGVATVLKRHNPKIRIVVVEPAESSVLLGGPAGPHKIEGVGIGYIPPVNLPTDAAKMATYRAREALLPTPPVTSPPRFKGGSGQAPRWSRPGRLRSEVPEHRRKMEPLADPAVRERRLAWDSIVRLWSRPRRRPARGNGGKRRAASQDRARVARLLRRVAADLPSDSRQAGAARPDERLAPSSRSTRRDEAP
jgi:hypothetical protein